MAIFENNVKKVKSKKTKESKEPKVVKRRSRFSSEGVETIVEVKTVGDIPPVLEARKKIGENDLGKAALLLFNAARDDYSRYFLRVKSNGDGSRNFFIHELSSLKTTVPEIGYVDNNTITEALDSVKPVGEEMVNRVNALKKLTYFYLNYYERARYAVEYPFDGEELVSKFSEIYNYMDIMQLYFSRHSEGYR